MQLTPKQEKFCLVYAEIGNASEAYRQSYDASKMSVSAVTTESSLMLKRHDIALTLDKIRAKMYELFEVSAGLKKKVLFDHMNSDDRSSSIKAVAELNKMDGHLAAVKTANANITVTQEEWLSQLKQIEE